MRGRENERSVGIKSLSDNKKSESAPLSSIALRVRSRRFRPLAWLQTENMTPSLRMATRSRPKALVARSKTSWLGRAHYGNPRTSRDMDKLKPKDRKPKDKISNAARRKISWKPH